MHSLKKASWSSPQFGQWGGEVGQQPETGLVSPPTQILCLFLSSSFFIMRSLF